jgi:hypothetical protein
LISNSFSPFFISFLTLSLFLFPEYSFYLYVSPHILFHYKHVIVDSCLFFEKIWGIPVALMPVLCFGSNERRCLSLNCHRIHVPVSATTSRTFIKCGSTIVPLGATTSNILIFCGQLQG